MSVPAKVAVFVDGFHRPFADHVRTNYSSKEQNFAGQRVQRHCGVLHDLHYVCCVSQVAKPHHFSFLADGTGDPRPEFMRQLKGIVSSRGSVVVYNASFEKGRLEECYDHLTAYRPWYRQIERRIVDLLVPFRGFGLGGSGKTLSFVHGGRDEGFDAFLMAYAESGQGVVIMIGAVNRMVGAVSRDHHWPEPP